MFKDKASKRKSTASSSTNEKTRMEQHRSIGAGILERHHTTTAEEENHEVPLTPISRQSSAKKSLSTSFRRLIFGCRDVHEENHDDQAMSRSHKYLPDSELFGSHAVDGTSLNHDVLVDDNNNSLVNSSTDSSGNTTIPSSVLALLSPRGSNYRLSTTSPLGSSPSKRRSANFESPNGSTTRMNGSISSTPEEMRKPSRRSKIFAGALSSEEEAQELLMKMNGEDPYQQKIHLVFEGQFEVKECHHLDTISDILPAFKDCVTPFVKIDWSIDFFNTITTNPVNNMKKQVPIVKPISPTVNPAQNWRQMKKTTVTCLEVGNTNVAWNEVLDFSITIEGAVHRNIIDIYKQKNVFEPESTKPYPDHVIGTLTVKCQLFDYDDLLLQENIISHHTLEFPITLKGMIKGVTASSPPINSTKIELISPLEISTSNTTSTNPLKMQAIGTTKANSPVAMDSYTRQTGFESVLILEKNQAKESFKMSQGEESEIVLHVLPVVDMSYYVKVTGICI